MESRFFQGVTAGRGCCGLKSGGKPGRDTPGACGGQGRWASLEGTLLVFTMAKGGGQELAEKN